VTTPDTKKSKSLDDRAGGDVDSKIVAALERIAQALQRTLWDAAWQDGLSATQAQLLLYILSQDDPGLTLSELAQRFDLKLATVSDAARVLVEKGLLVRRRDPGDARAARFHLTRKGLREAATLSKWVEAIRQQVAALEERHKGPFLATLLELIGRLNQAGVVSVARQCTTCLYFEANRYRSPEAPHHCRLLDKPLALTQLRVDCPDHKTHPELVTHEQHVPDE